MTNLRHTLARLRMEHRNEPYNRNDAYIDNLKTTAREQGASEREIKDACNVPVQHIAYDRNGHSYMCSCSNPDCGEYNNPDYDILDDSWGREE